MFSGLFSNILSNFRMAGKSSVDALLDQEDCTLEMILTDEEVISEFKYGNQRLIDFCSRNRVE